MEQKENRGRLITSGFMWLWVLGRAIRLFNTILMWVSWDAVLSTPENQLFRTSLIISKAVIAKHLLYSVTFGTLLYVITLTSTRHTVAIQMMLSLMKRGLTIFSLPTIQKMNFLSSLLSRRVISIYLGQPCLSILDGASWTLISMI